MQQFLTLFRYYLTLFVISLLVVVLQSAISFPTVTQAQTGQCEDRTNKGIPPSEIWIEVNTFFAVDWGRPQPFAYSSSFTLDEYIAGTVLGELGANVGSITNASLPSNNGLWEDATVEALTIAARSFSWYRLNYATSFSDPHYITRDNLNQCGFYDSGAQTFRPYYNQLNTTELREVKERYTAIVAQHVPDIYLVEGSGTEPIDAAYKATVGEYSEDGDKDYLAPIFNPISAGDTPNYKRLGMGQWGAQRWAMGQNDAGDAFPKWSSYQQILFHYYTGVNLRIAEGALLDPPPGEDRFNVLRVSGMPTLLRPGRTYQASQVQLQNTGVNDWVVTELDYAGQTCNSSETNLSYHLYELDNIDLACGDQLPGQGEDPGGKECFEGYRNELCLVGENALAPGKSISLDNVNIFIPAPPDLLPGHYWLRWDTEFAHSDGVLTLTWGSRLQVAPYTAQWFTQNRIVVIGKSNYPELANLDSSSHQINVWSSASFVLMEWDAPDDAIATDYYRYRWQADDYEGNIWHDPDSWACDNWQCTDNLEVITDLPDSNDWELEIYSVAKDGETNNPLTTGPFKIDTKAPTATLTALPARVTTSEYLLAWDSGDSGGSGVAEDQLSYQINGGAWSSVSGVSDPNTQSFQFDFPGGQHGDTFTFCLEVVDEVGWSSEASCSSTRYSPNPEFSITPQTISRMKVYSDSTPLVWTIQIYNVGGGELNWTATAPTTWTVLSANTGIAPSTVLVTVTHPLTIGVYTNIITFTGPANTYNNPQVVKITINAVKEMRKQHLPIIFK